jgi:thioesterase domain-containing protein/acyl carrier protein
LDLPAPPRDAIESELINIWQQVLGISPIGIYNSFFELGGDSLLAVQVLTQIEQRFEIALSISTPLAAPDIASLAELIRQGGDRQTNRDVVLLRPSQHPSTQHPSIPAPSPQHSSTQAPANVFCLYGLLLYRDLAACLPPHVNVYGVCLQEEIALLQQGNVAQMSQIFSSVEQITDRYVAAIQAVQPHGPYWFVGESFGGIIAYEVARRLTACGESVELVAMLDTYVTTVFDLSRVERLRHHAQALIAEGPHYIQVKVQRRWLQLRSRLAKLRASRAKFSPLSPSSSPQQNSQDLDDIRELARTQALHRYFPSRYEGKVLLLRAQDRERFSTADPTLGWGPFAPQLLLGEVPGDHLGILKPPHVQALAAQVNPHLPQARLLGPVGGIVESRVTPPQGDRRLAGPRLASIESDALELPPLQSAPLESAPL